MCIDCIDWTIAYSKGESITRRKVCIEKGGVRVAQKDRKNDTSFFCNITDGLLFLLLSFKDLVLCF